MKVVVILQKKTPLKAAEELKEEWWQVMNNSDIKKNTLN